MFSKTAISLVLFQVFLYQEFQLLHAQSWIQAGYWHYDYGSPTSFSYINSTMYTHLLCAFADVNSSSYELSVSADERFFSTFTSTIKQRNPSVSTILSIGGGTANYTVISLMVSDASTRKTFIKSSIRIARLYGFLGLDLSWVSVNTTSDMSNMGLFFKEWRAAAKSEAKISSNPELILTTAVQFQPSLDFASYPVESIRVNLNWINVMAYDYYMPTWANFTGPHAALYDPTNDVNTDFGIRQWIDSGISASKLVLSLPFYGYAWKLRNPKDNAIGAPAIGPAITEAGDVGYKDIKVYIKRNGGTELYNSTFVVNYCTIGSTWIEFDDVQAIKTKVAYARDKKLLGYIAWQIPYDDNWVLSNAADILSSVQQVNHNDVQHHNRQTLVIISSTTAISVVILLGFIIYYLGRRLFKSKGIIHNGGFHGSVPELRVFSFADIELATDKFSIENKLGQGGYGPVYKGILSDGKEVAVKLLSKASTQGFEEFKNEVTLTARLQHVNLVRLLGFYIDKEEQLLVYEYMPNKSLDYYLFDPIRKLDLDWSKRVAIIEGVIQGLLYLQEYSRLTIIHRDIKASNILLDKEMKPKISDFGMARIFTKEEHEANTDKIVGTYGYVPPEYIAKGSYSVKSDVYSFGVLLLQIISGMKTARLYGEHENINLMEHAYDLWKEGRGMEFADTSLDDTSSSCKLLRCTQIALLCVQEDASDRPFVLEISSMLRNETTLAVPKKPAFSVQNDMQQGPHEIVVIQECSVNEATISEFVAR